MRFACNVYCEIELSTTSGWELAPHGCIVHGVRDTHPRICRFNMLNTFVAIERCDSTSVRGKSATAHLRCLFGLSSDGSCGFSCSTADLQVPLPLFMPVLPFASYISSASFAASRL